MASYPGSLGGQRRWVQVALVCLLYLEEAAMVRFKIPNSVCGRSLRHEKSEEMNIASGRPSHTCAMLFRSVSLVPPLLLALLLHSASLKGAPPPASQEWSAVTYDNGTKRSADFLLADLINLFLSRIPSQLCVPDQFCKYGMVTYVRCRCSM